MLPSLALIILVGLALAALCQTIRLPRIIGMLFAGILLGPYVLNLLDDSILGISADLRQIALLIILLKAGLSLNLADLKKVGRPAVLMSCLPASCEILAFLLFAPALLGINRLEAAVMGSVLAAVSPAVVVPRMVQLMESGYGTNKSIPQLIMAGASCDDIFVIVLFSTFVGMAQGGSAHWQDFAAIPVSIGLGVLPLPAGHAPHPERAAVLRHRLPAQSHGAGGHRLGSPGPGFALRAAGALGGGAGHPHHRAAGRPGHGPDLPQTAGQSLTYFAAIQKSGTPAGAAFVFALRADGSLHLFFQDAGARRVDAHMAGNAAGQVHIGNGNAGECRLHQPALAGGLFLALKGSGGFHPQPSVRHRADPGGAVLLQGFHHLLFRLLHPPGLGVGIQFIPLDGQHRFQVQHRGKGCRCRGDAAALFQILHGIHRDIDAGIVGPFFQPGFDLPAGHAAVGIGRNRHFHL